MAELSDAVSDSHSEEHVPRRDLNVFKSQMEGWREVLVPLRSILVWEKPFFPAIIVGVVSLVFGLIYFLDPSVLTSFALVGLIINGVDFVVPFIGPKLFGNQQWTGSEERKFEDMCEKILKIRGFLYDLVNGVVILKVEKPKFYFVFVMVSLTICAWVGYIFNNLFLTYALVLAFSMVPGLQQKGIIDQYFLKYWLMFKKLVFGRIDLSKPKTQ